MLIARAPVRVSFFGGGTDLPAYYLQQDGGGAVLSGTINKYVYVILNVSDHHELQITSSDYRTFYRHTRGTTLVGDGELSLSQAVLHHFGADHGLSVFLASEVPPGTGLGSSGSVAVALVKAMSAACGHRLSAHQVAELACRIEIEELGKPVGRQDQYAAAFGGFNWLTFSRDGVRVERLALPRGIVARMEANLVLAFTGVARNSATILAEQSRSSKEGDPAVLEALRGVHELARQGRELLLAGELDRFGDLLDRAWQHKRRFASGVTNERIERLYAIARDNGALGGKIAGAGGGGFLIVYCADGASGRVREALEREEAHCMDFRFETDGARVLFSAGLRFQPSPPTEASREQRVRVPR